MSIVSVLSDVRCELGEGPFYCERRETLFWFDIVGSKRHAYDFPSQQHSVLDLPEMASAMAVVDKDHDLIFTESGLWSHVISTGAWIPVASFEADNFVTRSNDARVHPSGAFWLGTMGKNAEKKAGAIYHFRAGELTTLFENITIPNAICFSGDGRTAYFTDTVTEKLMSVSVDAESGLPVGEPSVFIDHVGKSGGLDGAVVDGDGNIWVALWGGSCVNCYDNGGVLLTSLELPALQISCPAFVTGGQMVVTSAWQGLSNAQREADPHGGRTFIFPTAATPKFEPRAIV